MSDEPLNPRQRAAADAMLGLIFPLDAIVSIACHCGCATNVPMLRINALAIVGMIAQVGHVPAGAAVAISSEDFADSGLDWTIPRTTKEICEFIAPVIRGNRVLIRES